MTCPAPNRHIRAALAATTRAERLRHIRAFTRPIFAAAAAEDARRLAAGICASRDCSAAIKGGDAGPFDVDHCADCARRLEIEMLVEEQEEDR